jgi:hypothetical protein
VGGGFFSSTVVIVVVVVSVVSVVSVAAAGDMRERCRRDTSPSSSGGVAAAAAAADRGTDRQTDSKGEPIRDGDPVGPREARRRPRDRYTLPSSMIASDGNFITT